MYNQQIFTFQIAEHLFRRGEDLAALAAFREALEYDPKNLRALRGLVSLLQKRGRQEEAVMYLRRQAGAEMEHLHLPQEIVDTIVSFRMAVLGGAPARPGHRPITSQSHFDNYAPHFEHHLCQTLEYRGPELLQEALTRVGLAPGMLLDVLDAGCGTGLAGPLFRSWARQLDGVDLSPRMLAQARERGLYDRLDLGDLTETLLRVPELTTSSWRLTSWSISAIWARS